MLYMMIDIEIQISISERSSGWATNQLGIPEVFLGEPEALFPNLFVPLTKHDFSMHGNQTI